MRFIKLISFLLLTALNHFFISFPCLINAQGLPSSGDINSILVFVNASDSTEFLFDKRDLTSKVEEFYSEMSFGKLNIDIDSYTIDIDSADDFTNYKEANNYVLESLDSLLDFSDYSNYKDTNIVEGIFIVYDDFYHEWDYNPIWSGVASVILNDYERIYDGKRFFSKVEVNNASGITVRAPNNLNYTFWVIVHEIGHLLGLSHFPVYKQNPFLQLMNPTGSYWGINRGMAFWEKEELGWIKPELLLDLNNYMNGEDSVQFGLDDYMTTGHYVKLVLPGSDAMNGGEIITKPGKSIFLERRSKISRFDQDYYKGDEGIFLWWGKGNLIHADGIADYDVYPTNDAFGNNELFSKSFDTLHTFERIIDYKINEYYDLATYELPVQFDFEDSAMINLYYGPARRLEVKRVILDREFRKKAFLFNNYPNPFNPSTIVNFDLFIYADVELRIIDLLGREVAVLHEGRMFPGNYSFEFEAGDISSGIYFAHLQLTTFEISNGTKPSYFNLFKKMIYLK